MKESTKSVSPATENQKQAGKFLCKTCKRNHNGNLDGPGYGHWPFPATTFIKVPVKDENGQYLRDGNDKVITELKEVQSKPSIMYENLLSQPKLPIFIPLEQEEKLGALASCTLNGLMIKVFKGAYVDVPEQIAYTLRESLNQTSRIPFDAKTAPNPFTGIQSPANLNLRSESDKAALNA